MTYTAPDGHIIESEPYPQVVTYSCQCTNYDDGLYYNYEIKGAATPIGIQGIHINRAVENNLMVSLGCYPNADTSPTTPGSKTIVHTCSVANIPIQKWVKNKWLIFEETPDIYQIYQVQYFHDTIQFLVELYIVLAYLVP